MTRLLTRKVVDYGVFAAGALAVAVASGNKNLAIIGTAFAAILAIGLSRRSPTQIAVDVGVTRDTLAAGESAAASIRLRADAPVHGEATLAPGPAMVDPDALRELVLRPDPTERRIDLRFDRWGRYEVRIAEVRAAGLFFMFIFRAGSTSGNGVGVRVRPRAEPLRAPLLPVDTRSRTGDFRSRRPGDGLEFASIREWTPGDRARRINWRMTSRSRRLLVNQYHAEESADFVLLIDTFTDVAEQQGSTLERAVAAASGIADWHLAQRDRVGLVSFGTHVAWIAPNVGRRQAFRIREALLDVHLRHHDLDRDIGALPRRVFESAATVVAFTPLVDERMLEALLRLRSRGARLAVVELDVDPGGGAGDIDRLTQRIWKIRQRGRRAVLTVAGVPVATWPFGQPFEYAAEQLRATSRRWQRAS